MDTYEKLYKEIYIKQVKVNIVISRKCEILLNIDIIVQNVTLYLNPILLAVPAVLPLAGKIP